MDDVDLDAFEPVPFPELGPDETFNANFCRNPMCRNFGPAPNRTAYADRYTVFEYPGFLNERRYKCKYCYMTSRLISNRSLRAAYVWFKRQSIPFAACDREDCRNYGVNLFEHWAWERYRPDNRNDPDVVECRRSSPRHRFRVGEASRQHGTRGRAATLDGHRAAVFKHVRAGVGMRSSMLLLEDPDVHPQRYLNILRMLSYRIRDYQSYSNARLMAPGYPKRLARLFARANDGKEPGPLDSPFNGLATLHTDTMSISLRMPTKEYPDRQYPLPVMITALRIHRPSSWFLLSVHPCVVFGAENLPWQPRDDFFEDREDDGEDDREYEADRDAALPVAQRRFDHLDHYSSDQGENESLERKVAHLGAGGLFMRRDYRELAHFMVVRELTRRFRKVALCMDGEKTAYKSAAAVFSDDIRDRRVEMAIVQSRKTGDGSKSTGDRKRAWERQKKRVAGNWRTKIRAELAKGGEADLGQADKALRLARAKARLFLQPIQGAWSKEGQWAWLRFPPGGRSAILWFTQGPNRDWPPEGEAELVLRYANLQSVDSAIQAIRRRAPAARRPRYRAVGGPSYIEGSENAEIATCGLWLAWFSLNYDRPWTDAKDMSAALLGLLRNPRGFRIDRQLGFRLGWPQAQEIAEELRDG